MVVLCSQQYLVYNKVTGKASHHKRDFKIIQMYNMGTFFLREMYILAPWYFFPVGGSYAICDPWYELNTVSHSIFGLNESTRVLLSGLHFIQGTESAGGNHLISVRLENFCQTSLSKGRG